MTNDPEVGEPIEVAAEIAPTEIVRYVAAVMRDRADTPYFRADKPYFSELCETKEGAMRKCYGARPGDRVTVYVLRFDPNDLLSEPDEA